MSIRLLPPEQRVIRRVALQSETDARDAWLAAIRKIAAKISTADLTELLADESAMSANLVAIQELVAADDVGGELSEAAAAAEAELILAAKIQTILGEFTVRLEPILNTLILRAGETALPIFNETMAVSPPLSLEAFQREAVGLAKEITANAVTAIGAEARVALREIVSRGFDEGLSPSGIAKRIAAEIGLDARRAAAYEKFVQALQEDAGDLSEEQIQRLLDQEYNKKLRSRALTIARTETAAAAAATQNALWEAAESEGRLPANVYVRQWIRIPASRPCPICGPLQWKRAKIGGVFRANGRTYTSPPAHPNCKCGERLMLWHEGDENLPAA